jgi:hypothetical protein
LRLIRSCTVATELSGSPCEFVTRQLVDRPQSPVAEVIDVVDLDFVLSLRKKVACT